jgi:germination protein M
MVRGAAVVSALAVLPAALPAAAPARHVGQPVLRSAAAVFLVRGEHVAPVRRVGAHTPAVARAAVSALLRGPTASERKDGYSSAIPARTGLGSISVSRGVATVDFSSRFELGGGSLSMQLRVAQVVYTLTQFPSVGRVAFRLDGRPVEWIGGEGVSVSPPVGRADFEAQTPPILVEQPLPGDSVGASILVRGTANVFEARLVVDLVTPSGVLLARRNLLATAGTGTRGRFSTRLSVPPELTRLVIVAYARSPKNGARIDVVRIPVVVPFAS